MGGWKLQLALCLFLGALVACEASPLETKTWFPDHPSLEFLPGKLARAIIGVRNPSPTSFNLTGAVGSLALVHNPDGSIYNFTGAAFYTPELAPGAEVVVEYGMPFPANIPARDFVLRINMFFSTGEKYDGALLFNETISVIETTKLVDMELIGLYLILAACLAAAAYGLVTLAKGKGWIKKPRKKTAVAPSSGASDKSEWLKGTVADKAKKAAAKKQG